MSDSTPEPWIDTAEACRHLAISVSTLHRWIKAGKAPGRRTPSGEFRFRRSELDAVIEKTKDATLSTPIQ